MKVGLIARADNTGLGIQSKEFFDHILCKALVIDMTEMSKSSIITPDFGRYPGQRVWKLQKGFKLTGGIPERIVNEFLEGLDIVWAMETPYDYNIFFKAKSMGIKTVLQLNYEFLDYPAALPYPDLFASPSMWYWDNIPNPKKLLPFPVDLTKFKHERKEKTFLHIAGRPAYNDRNGTQIFADSLRFVKNKINVIVKSQEGIVFRNRNHGVKIDLDYTNKKNYWENYSGGGVLVLPRKFGGQSLPVNEALASGMPVVASNCSPNNTWLPPEWLVECRQRGVLHCKKDCAMFETNSKLLAAKIDQFCDPGFYNQAVEKAIELGKSISWETMLPIYNQTMQELCS